MFDLSGSGAKPCDPSALEANFRRGESERADGAGAVAVWSRWLPRLSAAVERGVWWRINYTLHALNRLYRQRRGA